MVIQQYVTPLTTNFKPFQVRQLISFSQSSLPHFRKKTPAFHSPRYLISSAKNNIVILWFLNSDTIRSGSLTKGNSEESWKYMSFLELCFRQYTKSIFSNTLFCIQKVLHYTFTCFSIKCKAYSYNCNFVQWKQIAFQISEKASNSVLLSDLKSLFLSFSKYHHSFEQKF